MRARRLLVVSLALGVTSIRSLAAQSAADSAAIRATALDYIEGWYTGDADRMTRAVHPELAKRIVTTNAQGQSRLDSQSAMTLVTATRMGGGKRTPVDRQQKDVTILDIFQNAASAKVVASDWVDYLQLARVNGNWRIINVLWELKAR
jgi:thiamine pyrophosphokinase